MKSADEKKTKPSDARNVGRHLELLPMDGLMSAESEEHKVDSKELKLAQKAERELTNSLKRAKADA